MCRVFQRGRVAEMHAIISLSCLQGVVIQDKTYRSQANYVLSNVS